MTIPSKSSEGERFYARIFNRGDIELRFNSAFGKFLYVFIPVLIVFGILDFKLIEINYIFGFIFLVLLFFCVVWIFKKTFILMKDLPWLFVAAELVIPVFRMLSIGQKNKENREITKLPIVKQTVVQTISGKASIINSKQSEKLIIPAKT